MFFHIKSSICGRHSLCQDSIAYWENEERIVAIVADGLGSRSLSGEGSKLICSLLCKELRSTNLPISGRDLHAPESWYKSISERGLNEKEFATTCSFAVIDKKRKRVSFGQIGDSPIFFSVDNQPVRKINGNKEFLNVTECLQEGKTDGFNVLNACYSTNVRFLIASDGIGDELNPFLLNDMFVYLSDKYSTYKPSARSRQFTKEIKSALYNLNDDDKSAIYVWSL